MIKVERGPRLPVALDGEASRGRRERQRVVEFWQGVENGIKALRQAADDAEREKVLQSFDFWKGVEKDAANLREAWDDPERRDKALEALREKALQKLKAKFGTYSDDSIKAALGEIFHGKCAYCESRYAGTQPMDVEHWRPKGMVVRDDGTEIKPAYYWLAAEWTNLLPSCIDCNRERGQEVISFAGSTESRAAGKKCRFPLADEATRATRPGEEQREEALLLDPCSEIEPGDHLEFLHTYRRSGPLADRFDLDAAAVVRPRLLGGKESRRGAASIEVYALNRTGLVHERKEVLLLVRERIFVLEKLAEIIDRAQDSQVRNLALELWSHEIAALRRMGEPHRPFAQMVRQVAGRLMGELTGRRRPRRRRPATR